MGKKTGEMAIVVGVDVHRQAKVAAINCGESLRGFTEKAVLQRLSRMTSGEKVGKRVEVEVGWPSEGSNQGLRHPGVTAGSQTPFAVETGLASGSGHARGLHAAPEQEGRYEKGDEFPRRVPKETDPLKPEVLPTSASPVEQYFRRIPAEKKTVVTSSKPFTTTEVEGEGEIVVTPGEADVVIRHPNGDVDIVLAGGDDFSEAMPTLASNEPGDEPKTGLSSLHGLPAVFPDGAQERMPDDGYRAQPRTALLNLGTLEPETLDLPKMPESPASDALSEAIHSDEALGGKPWDF